MEWSITEKKRRASLMYIFVVITLWWAIPVIASAEPSFCNTASPDYIGAAQIPYDTNVSLIPIWTEILQNNVGTIQAGIGNGSGVPDLDRLGDELLFSESIGNVIHLFNNYLKAKVGPSVAANLMDPSQVGIGICQIGTNEYSATTRITYCDHSLACSGTNAGFNQTSVLWLPQAASVFNNLNVNIRLPQAMVDTINTAVSNLPLPITFDPTEPVTVSLFDVLEQGPVAIVDAIANEIQGLTVDVIIPTALTDAIPAGLTILPSLSNVPLGDFLATPFEAIATELNATPQNSQHPGWQAFLDTADALQKIDSAESITVKHQLDVNFAETRKKWADKQLAKLDDLTSSQLASIFNNVLNAAGSVVKGAGKFKDKVEAFENTLTTYGEGFHLGAYDEQRPTLHQCIGFYGSGVNSKLAGFNIGSLGVSIGSSYFSHEISKNFAAQARFGTTQLSIGNKTLPLNASASIHTQIDGLKNFDCEVPFGINLAGKFGKNICPNFTGLSGPQLCTANTDNSYVSIDDNSGATGTAGIKDYYPVQINGNVVWPRFDPAGDFNFPSTAIVSGDAPSHASVSAGLNASFDSGFDPSPKLIRTIPISPPLQAALYMKLDWGLNWFHDSMHVRDILADNVSASGIDMDAVFSRDMHPMQAEDVTTEDGVGYYLNPAIIVAAGLIYTIPQNPQNPQKKPRVTFNLSADLGLYVDLSTEFSGGIADTGQVIQDILQNSSSDPTLSCEPVMETKVIGEKCDGNLYEKDTPELIAANELINVVYQDSSIKAAQPIDIQATMTSDDYISEIDIALITNSETITPYIYSCDGASFIKAIIVDEDERPIIENKIDKEGKEYDTVTFYEPKSRRCSDYGFCSTDGFGQSEKSCTADETNLFTSYQCNPIVDREIVGWTGNGCSPLLSNTPYPTAPGEQCSAASGTSDCGSGFACQDGACLTQCTSDNECSNGESCSADGLCELNSGMPYAEQIPWRASHPDSLRPYHAVWSHAISKAEANADFGLGLNINIALRLFKRTFTLVDGRVEKFWNLGNWPIVKYQSGLEAPYNNSCVAGGVMTNYQTTDSDNIVRVKRPDPNSPDKLIDVITGQTTTEQFIDLCNDQLGENSVDPNLPLANEVMEEGTSNGVDFSEDVAWDLWNANNENMCVNGMPWETWLNSVSEGATANNLPFSLNDGTSYYPINDSLNIALLNASGCLAIANVPNGSVFFGNNLRDIIPTIGNKVDISAMLIDANGEIIADNFKPQYASKPQFSLWISNLENCMESYLDSHEFSLTQVTFEPCSNTDDSDIDKDGIPSVKDNCPLISNRDQLDSDFDGVGDACDNCTDIANHDQLDSDNNGIGNACQTTSPIFNDWIVLADSLEGVSVVIEDTVIGNTVTVDSVLDDVVKLPAFEVNDDSIVVINSGTFEVSGDVRISQGILEVKNGSFSVGGSLLIQKAEATDLEPAQASTGQLVMRTEGAILNVHENLIVNTTKSGKALLTQGDINVDGNVIQTCSENDTELCNSGFVASNNHTLNLTANNNHRMSFDTPESSTINNLVLSSNSATEFDTKVIVKGQIQSSGAKITLADGITIAGIESDKDGDGIVDSTDNCPEIANSNQNSSACQTTQPPIAEEKKSGGAINTFVLIIMIFAMALRKAIRLKSLLLGLFFMTAVVHAAPNSQTSYQNLTNHLEEKLKIKIHNITNSPVSGLLEITSEKGVFYSTAKGDYFIHGSITDVNDNFRNLTLLAQNKVRQKRIELFSDSMIYFPAEKESHIVTVFTDVDCGYCRKLHSQIAEYNQLGITVRYLAFPRKGVGSKTWQLMQSLWCSDDKVGAMNTLKTGHKITKKSCDNAVASHYKLGKELGIRGTPAIILDNGQMLPGFKPPKQLLAMMARGKS